MVLDLEGFFANTAELKVMKYNDGMLSDKIGWSNAVEEEYDRMEINKVWIPTKLKDVPRGVKVRTLT